MALGEEHFLPTKKTAKYLNSPESEIYHKSRVLYGLNLAKKTIIEKDLCYLVEGYTDVISFHQNGVENVVASSGTSLTTEQIRLIKRYTPNITILFDGDTAGIKAAFRGIDMILEEGMNVKVLAFPEGEDPDSFARSKSTEELSSFLKENAQDFIRFKTSLLVSEVGKDPMKRASLIKEIVNSIALIPDPIARSVYIQESGDILDISEQALMSELNKVRRNTLSKKIQNKEREEKREDFGVTDDTTFLQEKPKPQEKPLIYQEEDIIRTLIKFGNQDVEIPKEKDDDEAIVLTVAEYVVFEMEEDNLSFTHPLFDKIYALFKTAVESETSVVENTLVSNEDKELSSFAIECLMDKYTLSINWYDKHQILTLKEEEILQKKVHRGVCSWRLTKVQQMLEDMQAALKENPDNYESIYEEISRLLQAKKALGNELGRIVLR